MARRNYRLVINSQFNPFSYEELMAPVLMATQTHQQLENEYGNLAAQANELYRKLNAERDKKSVATYNSYMSALDSLASQLASKGLDQSSRRNAISANTNYHKHIIPIIEGYNRRAAAEKAQQEMLSKDPTHLYARMAKDLSVDDFVDDQTLDVLSENYSGELLTQQVRTAAADILRQNRKVGGLRGMGIPYKYEQMFHNGKTEEEVVRTMMESGDADPFLQSVLDTVMNNSGIANWSTIKGNLNDPTYRRALGFAKRGLSAAIGGNNWKYFDDNYNMQLGLLKQRQSGSGSGVPPWYKGGMVNPNPLYSTDPKSVDYLKQIEKAGWIKKGENRYEITDLGKKNLQAMKTEPKSYGPASTGGSKYTSWDGSYVPSAFASFILGDQASKYKDLDDTALNNALNNRIGMYKDFESGDAYREIKFDHYLNPDSKAAIVQAIAPQSLSRAAYKGRGKGFEYESAKKGENVGINWTDWEPFNIYSTRYGDILQIRNKGTNEVQDYQMPVINSIMQNGMAQAYSQAYTLFDVANQEYEPELDSKGNPQFDANGNIVLSNRKFSNDQDREAYRMAGMQHAWEAEQMKAQLSGRNGVDTGDYRYSSIPLLFENTEPLPWFYGQSQGQTGSYYDNEQ